MGFDRGARPRRRGRADGGRVSPRSAWVAVSALSRRATVADLHIRTNRLDPDPPPHRDPPAVQALEAPAREAAWARITGPAFPRSGGGRSRQPLEFRSPTLGGICPLWLC